MEFSKFVVAAMMLRATSLFAVELGPGDPVALAGSLTEPEELSGATFYGDLLVICPDEGCQFDVLEPANTNDFRLLRSVPLSDNADKEIDLEGAASDGEFLYLIGSHSLTRRPEEPDETHGKNRARLSEVRDEPNRDKLFRLTLGEHGKVKSKEKLSLRKLLEHDEILHRFTNIPSKENGVDIEGIAVSGQQLYVGFRGPVLRGNFVPVMVLEFDSPEDYTLRFVNLGGRGIRDIATVKDGFLLIAGPIGDGDVSYQLYFWNGKDCLPGGGGPGGMQLMLGEIPTDTDVRAEGLAVLAEDNSHCTLLILYDGVRGGDAKRFTVKKEWN